MQGQWKKTQSPKKLGGDTAFKDYVFTTTNWPNTQGKQQAGFDSLCFLQEKHLFPLESKEYFESANTPKAGNPMQISQIKEVPT